MGTRGPVVNPLLSGSYCLVWVLIPDCLSLFSFPYKFCLSPYLAICNSWRWSVHMLWKFLFLSLKTSYEFPNEMFFFHPLPCSWQSTFFASLLVRISDHHRALFHPRVRRHHKISIATSIKATFAFLCKYTAGWQWQPDVYYPRLNKVLSLLVPW